MKNAFGSRREQVEAGRTLETFGVSNFHDLVRKAPKVLPDQRGPLVDAAVTSFGERHLTEIQNLRRKLGV